MAPFFVLLVLVGSFANAQDASICKVAASALQQWYNTATGLWNTCGWWNGANDLTTMIDYQMRSGDTTWASIIQNTFTKATPPNSNKTGTFITGSYDDELWWALAWINAYDATGNTAYFNMAETIFLDVASSWDSVCGGGVWWSSDKTYKNAVTNELFLQTATRLHNRIPGDTTYLTWATKEWSWFYASGMINSQNLVNDGLDNNCKNNGQTTWTYNQGVILAGLADLAKITGNSTLLTIANNIASAARTHLTTNDILVEPCEPNCNGDQTQFKGIFMRDLYYLITTSGDWYGFQSWIATNAASIWNNNKDSTNQFGLRWGGPFDTADASRHGSAFDCLNAVCFI